MSIPPSVDWKSRTRDDLQENEGKTNCQLHPDLLLSVVRRDLPLPAVPLLPQGGPYQGGERHTVRTGVGFCLLQHSDFYSIFWQVYASDGGKKNFDLRIHYCGNWQHHVWLFGASTEQCCILLLVNSDQNVHCSR